MLELSVEKWSDAIEEMKAHFPEHWEEVAVNKDRVKLAMDYERYAQIEAAGMIHLIVARAAGKIVGYFCLILNRHLHYKNDLMAMSDFYYITPTARTSRNAIQMFEFAENTLRERGVSVISATTKVHKDKSEFLDYMGWKWTEKQYSKVLKPCA